MLVNGVCEVSQRNLPKLALFYYYITGHLEATVVNKSIHRERYNIPTLKFDQSHIRTFRSQANSRKLSPCTYCGCCSNHPEVLSVTSVSDLAKRIIANFVQLVPFITQESPVDGVYISTL